ncbi:hypothetical protein MAA_08194 [Metarhizium robertsii ARSEF 23]|uniref:Uncharacterized protein n=1 Tax=Metarhizium robertsii (strain ARSEF 23 / ATCC MYA-3075) TaxID=655844 RepID=E9F7E5_METRA|nr:uncharacterized protein MAA_08194 [Metarhizium robertsii ARSEF 23]EFY96282.2 hypothetical protein MAA_08194 [Metarhizium robertsii ARSEF 23]
MYLVERKLWELYDGNVDNIPWRELAAEAARRNCQIADLMTLYPPELSTDRITEGDVVQATEYMRRRGLHSDAADLKGWMGLNMSGFVHLDITEPIFLPGKDGESLGRAHRSGCIDIEKIKAVAIAQARKMADESDRKCCINDASLGTAPRVIPRSVQDEIIRDGIHVTPRRNRLVRSGILSDMTSLVPISWHESDSPFGRSQLLAHDGQPSAPTDGNAYEPPIPQFARSTTAMAAMQSLINSSGAVQDRDNGLFGTAAGLEVSAVVSGGLSAGYQSLINRRETPARSVDQHDTTAEATEPPAAQGSRNPREFRKEIEALSNPVAAANTNSEKLRRALLSRFKHYLQEDNKAPVSRPRAPRPAPIEVVEDDSDYTPGRSTGKKRRQSVQAQKTPVKQRKLDTTPNTPVRCQSRGAPMTGSPGEAIKPLNLISIDPGQKASGQEGATLASHAPPSPGSVVAVSPCSRRPSKGPGAGGEPTKGKKNAAPIFGLHRNQELTRPVDASENAEYAWSADEAAFAANSQFARYALRADRLRSGSRHWPEDALAALTRLKDEFHAVEFQQRGSTTRNAGEIRFAGCASRAVYAEFAMEAEFAMAVSCDGGGEVDGDEGGS